MIQLSLPLGSSGFLPCSFGESAYQTAQRVLELRGDVAMEYIIFRQRENFYDEIDRAYWVEVRRACKFIQGNIARYVIGYWRPPVKG